jgi:hypothetical protein
MGVGQKLKHVFRLVIAIIALLGLFSISIEKPKNEISRTNEEMIEHIREQLLIIEFKKISEEL